MTDTVTDAVTDAITDARRAARPPAAATTSARAAWSAAGQSGGLQPLLVAGLGCWLGRGGCSCSCGLVPLPLLLLLLLLGLAGVCSGLCCWLTATQKCAQQLLHQGDLVGRVRSSRADHVMLMQSNACSV